MLEDKKLGRPSGYTPELADFICRLIACNPEGLNVLYKKHPIPHPQTIYNWIAIHPDFFDKYMKAKEQQSHVHADFMLDVPGETPTFIDKDGNERIDSGMLGRSKLVIDALKWHAARLAPRHYGDHKMKSAESQNEDIHKEAIARSEVLEKEY